MKLNADTYIIMIIIPYRIASVAAVDYDHKDQRSGKMVRTYVAQRHARRIRNSRFLLFHASRSRSNNKKTERVELGPWENYFL